MESKNYQVCGRCVMDTSDVEISFDTAGYCCHCTSFLEKGANHTYQGKESDQQLDRLISQIRVAGKRNAYDCVIGISGGADSSYLAYIAKEKGLRPLAVHMDNGWNSETAVTNIKNVTRKLGIDYESYVLDWEDFKDLQLAFLKASVPEAETPTDVAIPGALHQVAAKYNVKYILGGGHLATEGILPDSWHYDARDLRYFNHIHRTFGSKKLTKFPTFGYKREMYYKLARGIRMAYPLNLLPYLKKDVIKLLEERFGWTRPSGKHHESRYTKFIQSYYLYAKFGIDYRRATLSSEICGGQTRREEALEELKCRPYDPSQVEVDKKYIAKKLGIDDRELEDIISQPAKWHWDYPNDRKKLQYIYKVYRKVFNKEKLDRF